VLDLTENSKDKGALGFSADKFSLINMIKDFNYKHIYNHDAVARQKEILHKAIAGLFDYYNDLFERYGFTGAYAYESKNAAVAFGHFVLTLRDFYTRSDAPAKTIITDYIAGMTDGFAAQCAREALGIKLKFN
jgi:dGTP triphosphohydrolase